MDKPDVVTVTEHLSLDRLLVDQRAERLVATIPRSGERILRPMLDGAYRVARLGVRMFCKGEQTGPGALARPDLCRPQRSCGRHLRHQ